MPVISAFIFAFFHITFAILNFFIWMLIIGAILSWLVHFDVVNPRNRFVQAVGELIHRLTEPLLVRIRRIIPPTRGLDLSPLILIVIIWFLQYFLQYIAARVVLS